jgi:hypothetical protein
MKNMRRADSAPSQPAGRPGDVNAGLPGGGSSGLGDLLRGTLGGVLGGAAAGTVLNGLGGSSRRRRAPASGVITSPRKSALLPTRNEGPH